MLDIFGSLGIRMVTSGGHIQAIIFTVYRYFPEPFTMRIPKEPDSKDNNKGRPIRPYCVYVPWKMI